MTKKEIERERRREAEQPYVTEFWAKFGEACTLEEAVTLGASQTPFAAPSLKQIKSNLMYFLARLLDGHGTLRPAGASTSELHHYIAFLDRLVTAGKVSPDDAALAKNQLGDPKDPRGAWNRR